MSWHATAACAGLPVDWFFDDTPSVTSRAMWLCSWCPCSERCLTEAVAQGDKFGIRAGTTPWQRRLMRAELAA